MSNRRNDWNRLNTRIPKQAFPIDLARVVTERWDNICGGSYVTPPCPGKRLLKSLLEIAYLAASAPEEDRFPQFNILAAPVDINDNHIGQRWKFKDSRDLTVAEMRRLAPAADVRKSAIWLTWDDSRWRIEGLVDLGTSWHRSRIGLGYSHNQPSALLVQIDRPGRIRVYQGSFHVATLSDGKIEGIGGIEFHLSLHEPCNRGLRAMQELIASPVFEEQREYEGFEFIALWNTFAAIANSISISGHGGALIISPIRNRPSVKSLGVKYEQSSPALKNAFVAFMNKRHLLGDMIARKEDGQQVPDEQIAHAELAMLQTYDLLVEATRFVAQLAGCDGAILLSEDLTLLGFGAEIKATFRETAQVIDIADNYDEFNKMKRYLNVDQFGMRHRSAIKLVSREPRCRILVVSQDGPISAVWAEGSNVAVRRGVNLVNMNMIGA